MTRPLVVKLGGSLLDLPGRRDAVLDRLASLHHAGEPLVLVHGGGKALSRELAVRGIESRFVAGLRVTDAATLGVALEVLAGHVNKMLVHGLAERGVRTAGIAGCDAGTLRVRPHPPVEGKDLGLVGYVEGSDPGLLRAILGRGFLPVVATIGIGADGRLFNVNADPAATAIAAALGARRLVFLTDVAGVLDPTGAPIPVLPSAEAGSLIDRGVVAGGMLPKLRSSLQALAAGVGGVFITSGESFATNGLAGFAATVGTAIHA